MSERKLVVRNTQQKQKLFDTLTAEDLGLSPRISIEQLNAEGVSD